MGPRTGVDARGAPESIVTIRYITTRYDPKTLNGLHPILISRSDQGVLANVSI